jgi:tRNA A37 methylthiotransferase MiaB
VSWWGSKFAWLLREILDNTSIPRLRISSLWPEFIDDNVLEILEEERIYPHFHFSIQSGSSNTLKSMARHYDWEYMRTLLEKTRNIQRKDGVEVSIGADLIVWFPWESEEDFLDTYNLVKDFRITKVHAFPFSAHTMWESVPAGKFKNQVPEHIKKERMNKLMELWDTVRENFKTSQKWKVLKVLVEKVWTPKEETGLRDRSQWMLEWSGWSENYIECDQSNFEIIAGKIERNSILVWKYI